MKRNCNKASNVTTTMKMVGLETEKKKRKKGKISRLKNESERRRQREVSWTTA